MCLGVPGRVEAIEDGPLGMNMATVSFGGIRKQVCMAYVPEAAVGDYVLVHVGFALSRVDEEQAMQVFRYLEENGDLQDLQVPDAVDPEGPDR